MKNTTKKYLNETHPELLKIWDYEKNTIKPEDITAGSGKKVWWVCSIHGSYEQVIQIKTRGSGCPYCKGKRVNHNNCLATTHPELLKIWDYEKNTIKPEDITAGSGKKVWWVCPIHGSYEQVIQIKTRGSSCPYCAGRSKYKLSTTHPELLKIWDYEKNTIKPEQVTAGSNRKVWWVCSEHGSYQQKIYLKSKGSECPYCSGQKVNSINCLATTHPELLKIWDYEKNTIKPEEITAGSGKKVWWICSEHGSYEQRLNRKKISKDCPFCNIQNKKRSEKKLNETHPELLKIWDYERNTIKPEEITAGSGKKVWWICSIHGSYKQEIKPKSKGRGCPYCKGKRVNHNNCLATTHPQLLKIWDYEKNTIKPEQVTAGSGRKVWWVCSEHGNYQQKIYLKSKGSGCPYCAGRKKII